MGARDKLGFEHEFWLIYSEDHGAFPFGSRAGVDENWVQKKTRSLL
jgi:hypothetical protein